MKYNTISTSSVSSEGKKSTFTIYANMDITNNKISEKDMEISSVKGELEIVQKALKLQTKRCRQLVAEYTKRLQQKEQQYQSEKLLRDNQLAKVLRALLIFEARLKQEQKYISHQLKEKDYIINKQNNHIKKLLSNKSQTCKNCNQYYNINSTSPNLESLDSSSDYVGTDYQDYQSSYFESLDSSSENYATVSEKSYNPKNLTDNSVSGDDTSKINNVDSSSKNTIFVKNKGKDSLGRRTKKFPHRKSVGTYFEVLKLRNDSPSPCSNEDNTSNDYDNLDSLPPESVSDKISIVSERIENIFQKTSEDDVSENSSLNILISDCHDTVINNSNSSSNNSSKVSDIETKNNLANETIENQSESIIERKLSDSIAVFDGDGIESNDKWYASASDQEDEEQRDIYRNNPVLECVNQILIQNMNDTLNSPPKTPATERKSIKNKRVKFSDEGNTVDNLHQVKEDYYYETPINKTPNFYETPQSIYSNDYEQILSKCSSETPSTKIEIAQEKETKINDNSDGSHLYIDMDVTNDVEEVNTGKIIRKSKILRTPPALPPKPANLVSKHKITNLQNINLTLTRQKSVETLDSEPDYCSISELNLPTNKNLIKKISVVAEVHQENETKTKVPNIKLDNSDYDPVTVNDNISNLVVKKCVEKLNIQLAKQHTIKNELTINLQSPKILNKEPEIPKLPQVSEIIIPDENEEKENNNKKNEQRIITHDNYVKNNSQILKLKTGHMESRRPIVIGSSVSSLITGFNNQQLFNEIGNKKSEHKLDKKLFSSFENLQNLEKRSSPIKVDSLLNNVNNNSNETLSFDNFDLSQNFEEFKLDDCEIEEYNVDESEISGEKIQEDMKIVEEKLNLNSPSSPTSIVEVVRVKSEMVMPNLSPSSIELLKRELELQKKHEKHDKTPRRNNEPTYEHFLECTGLSSKSILTPSRMLSNHKSMLKPKDIKLRSKVKSNNLLDRHSNSTIKYWSEPFI